MSSLPIACMNILRLRLDAFLRLEKSIELWTKELGVTGYFSFLEETLGNAVKDSNKMEFATNADNLKHRRLAGNN